MSDMLCGQYQFSLHIWKNNENYNENNEIIHVCSRTHIMCANKIIKNLNTPYSLVKATVYMFILFGY